MAGPSDRNFLTDHPVEQHLAARQVAPLDREPRVSDRSRMDCDRCSSMPGDPPCGTVRFLRTFATVRAPRPVSKRVAKLVGGGALRDAVASGQVHRIVVAEPDLQCLVFPDQCFNGRSMPVVWAHCIIGVPLRGLPKISTWVGRSELPMLAAPAA